LRYSYAWAKGNQIMMVFSPGLIFSLRSPLNERNFITDNITNNVMAIMKKVKLRFSEKLSIIDSINKLINCGNIYTCCAYSEIPKGRKTIVKREYIS
jgi:hypothetical protein